MSNDAETKIQCVGSGVASDCVPDVPFLIINSLFVHRMTVNMTLKVQKGINKRTRPYTCSNVCN